MDIGHPASAQHCAQLVPSCESLGRRHTFHASASSPFAANGAVGGERW
ncbi:hypothetical protein GFS60_02099 [Rhodococcus sp. WAY2]|nr:hypothetical protein GFS60_02099 [Rhodococcus sp. WAY2]